MNARHLPQTDYQKLKAACRDLVTAAGGGTRACTITRACTARLSEALAPHCDERFMAIDQIADLEAETGEPIVTKLLADLVGYDLVRREPAPHHASLRLLIAAVNREAAQVTTKFLEAETDHRLTDKEKEDLRAEADDAIDRLQALRAALAPERKFKSVS